MAKSKAQIPVESFDNFRRLQAVIEAIDRTIDEKKPSSYTTKNIR